ncbi:MAG: hypothetical protein K8R88_13445 [Armatimonadetes bacterium]|nr:hypothetical protein [Armatimonadota bacterium]
MWCTYRDEQALGFLRNAFPQTLGELSTSRRWAIQQGLELRPENVTEPIQHVPELQGMQVLDHKLLRGRSNPLQVPGHSLSKLDSQENNVRRGRTAGLRVIHAPHVFFSTNGAIFSDVDFVLRHPQIGISAPSEDRIMLKAVAMLLWSSPFRFLTFFESTSIGISTSTITVSPVRAIPLPSLSSDQASTLAFLYDELADGFEGQLYDGSGNQFGQAAQEKLDQLVNQLLDLPPFVRIAASDFAAIKSHLIRGKRPPEFCRPTSDRELYDYGEVLSQELTEFAGVSHRVRLIRDAGSVNCWVDEGDFGASQIEVLANQNTSPASIDEYRRRRTQWAYVERSIYVVTDSSARIWKSDQRANWTRGQALVDSDQLIADFIQEAGLVKS